MEELILITAEFADEKDIVMMLKEACDEYLSKPESQQNLDEFKLPIALLMIKVAASQNGGYDELKEKISNFRATQEVMKHFFTES